MRQVRRLAFRSRGRSANSLELGGAGGAGGDGRAFLHIRPALADPRAAFAQRSHTTLTGDCTSKYGGKYDNLNLEAVGEGKVQLSRTPQEKDRLPDRITLDRRGLSSIPNIVGEPGLKLLSLQHNLINSLAGLAPLDLVKLVFLDVYDNQIDKISCLDRLCGLRVLLMGKNRIRRIDGLSTLIKLEVLDLHGNRIGKVSGLSTLTELKVLNLAGNQIKSIGHNDLQGLVSLRELNLKRNRLRKLLGFENTPRLQKLYLGNNDLQSVEDMSSVAEATSLAEVSLDGNPVALGGDCTPFLVAYLPNLVTLTNMHVTEQFSVMSRTALMLSSVVVVEERLTQIFRQISTTALELVKPVRRAAMAWRRNKEAAHAAYCALGGAAQQAARRDQVIHNARTNWELLRSENKSFTITQSLTKMVELEKEFVLEANTTTALTQSNGTQTTELGALPDVVASIQHTSAPAEPHVTRDDGTGASTELVPKAGAIRKLQRSATAKKPADKRVNFTDRSASQDTDGSLSTGSDLRLPPILLPIISTLENVTLNDRSEPVLKRWESVSSIGPRVESSCSSLPSTTSDSDEELGKKPSRRIPTAFRRRECASNISSSTNVGSVATSSASGSDQNAHVLRREGSLNSRLSNRNIRSATISRRNERSASVNRASTARVKSGKNLANLKSSEPVPKPVPVSKDREQGVDYLVEVGDGVVSAWGAGAVRRLSRDWDWDRAQRVTRAAFHYVHFNAVAQALPELKVKFPNVTQISVRATGLQWLGQLHAFAELRGLTALSTCCRKAIQYMKSAGVTEEEIKLANATYSGLGDLVLRALPDAPLQPLLARLGRSGASSISAKAWLRAADPALRDVIAKEALQYKKGSVSQEDVSWRVRGRAQLSCAINLACGAAQRLRILEVEWPTILLEMIEQALRDFSNMENHVKEQMKTLMDSL
ncbi:Leucine-rich repeat-containing protein 49 [Eumeta japonica]|uniref:Leucine-rich repeat-containing protein 49 n=1 Tax=Eumeta variegata TaxID=151549 RepID=A0A4C1X4E7_EUMVA|nr:Leucine-rich repeat-containing protein 49 [Eumeta japonica]